MNGKKRLWGLVCWKFAALLMLRNSQSCTTYHPNGLPTTRHCNDQSFWVNWRSGVRTPEEPIKSSRIPRAKLRNRRIWFVMFLQQIHLWVLQILVNWEKTRSWNQMAVEHLLTLGYGPMPVPRSPPTRNQTWWRLVEETERYDSMIGGWPSEM